MKKLALLVVILIGFNTMAQNFVAQNTEMNNVLYRGYENKYNFGQLGCEEDYELEGVNCELIKVNDDENDNLYIIKTKSGDKTASVNFVADGKVLGSVDFIVKALPRPDLYWGEKVDGTNFSEDAELSVKYETGLAFNASYSVISWSSTHDDKNFEGEGNQLSEDFLAYLNGLAPGETISITVKVEDQNGTTRLKTGVWTKASV